MKSRCPHSQAELCDDCSKDSDNLKYFGIALGIVARAVTDGRAEELFAHFTLWAKNNIADFPSSVADAPLYESEAFFPDTIENFRD